MSDSTERIANALERLAAAAEVLVDQTRQKRARRARRARPQHRVGRLVETSELDRARAQKHARRLGLDIAGKGSS